MIMDIKSWKKIKDDVYGKKGRPCRDDLDRDFDGFKIAWLQIQAGEENQWRNPNWRN